ncbi:MAG: hypothetical protein HRT74_05175 [Flavobacteriales bacterium]|nr:hypothetical protein [Flavobacteriales bacterium]
MRRQLVLILIAMLLSLFIYAGYRSHNTLINIFLASIFSDGAYQWFRDSIQDIWAIPAIVKYNLPEGLWVFAMVIAGRNLRIHLGKMQIRCVWLVVIFASVLECFQWFGFTKGTFDWLDLLMVVLFWAIGWVIPMNNLPQASFFPISKRGICFILIFISVYFAHLTS